MIISAVVVGYLLIALVVYAIRIAWIYNKDVRGWAKYQSEEPKPDVRSTARGNLDEVFFGLCWPFLLIVATIFYSLGMFVLLGVMLAETFYNLFYTPPKG